MFGRKRKSQDNVEGVEPSDGKRLADGAELSEGAEPSEGPDDATDAAGIDASADAADETADVAHDGAEGPFDSALVSNLEELAAQPTMLDLGSVVVPVPEGGQIQVDLAPNGAVNNVFVTIGGGRISMNVFAAPKSPGQWRDVVGELSESLRGEGATVSVSTGPWGREVLGSSAGGDLRFIGVDGPRWMLRCVVVGANGTVEADSELSEVAREIIRGTVVRRGTDPMPARTPLATTLPEALAAQLAGAREQQMAAHQQEQQRLAMQQLAQQQQAMSQALRGDVPPIPEAPTEPTAPRQNPNGSAMQQLRNKKN